MWTVPKLVGQTGSQTLYRANALDWATDETSIQTQLRDAKLRAAKITVKFGSFGQTKGASMAMNTSHAQRKFSHLLRVGERLWRAGRIALLLIQHR